LLELAVLGLLREGNHHGYELKKRLEELLGPLASISFGSLYPCLGRLERAGQVRVVDSGAPRAARVPLTGSLSGEAAAHRSGYRPAKRGRSRKVYAITESGSRRLQELLAREAAGEEDRTFGLRLAFARFLAPEDRVGMLERRRARLRDRLSRTRAAAETRREAVDAYTRSVIDHDAEAAERDLGWLETLIAAERQQEGTPS
jgi:DNA-binding PadR family transcriptional regulator